MTPMEAWHIVSANLYNYYQLCRSEIFKGYTDADVEAAVICFKALKEMQERGGEK